MTIPTTTMLDTVGADALNIPAGTHYVGVYVTGEGGVPWTSGEINLFPYARIVRIAQGAGIAPAYNGYDMIDVENGAVTPQQAAQMIADRVNKGVEWTTVYGTDATLLAVTNAVRAMGEHIWNGHVNYLLADWNLNEEQAAQLVGQLIHGASCVGVQWASPSSNPNTIVPGGTRTLAEANVDISVVDTNWVPSGGFGPPAPPVPAPSVKHGLLVTVDITGVFAAHAVSTLDGTHWS